MSLVPPATAAASIALASSAVSAQTGNQQEASQPQCGFAHFRACFENGRKGDYRNFYEKFHITTAPSFYTKAVEPRYLDLDAPELAQYSLVPPQCYSPTYERYRPFAVDCNAYQPSFSLGIRRD